MNDLILESIRTAILFFLFIYLARMGKKHRELCREGWNFIIAGFALLTFATLIDITDNFESLNRFMVIGDTPVQAFLEKIVGYLCGFLLLAIGLIKWIRPLTEFKEIERLNRQLGMEIGERRRAEEDLQKSEARFREMAELMPETIFELDERGNVTFVNQKGLATFGYAWEDVEAGLSALEIFVPEEKERGRKNIEKVLGGEELRNVEYSARRKDGSVFPILSYSSPVRRGNRIVGVRGIVVDITEREADRAKLKEYTGHMEEMVRLRTEELNASNQELERMNARQKILLDATFGREARMADLKKVIRKLRKQIEDNKLVPVVDDPLTKGTEEYKEE